MATIQELFSTLNNNTPTSVTPLTVSTVRSHMEDGWYLYATAGSLRTRMLGAYNKNSGKISIFDLAYKWVILDGVYSDGEAEAIIMSYIPTKTR